MPVRSRCVIDEVPGLSRVDYDVSGQPPATIERERSGDDWRIAVVLPTVWLDKESTPMTLAEAIYEHSKKLPEDAAREVLDFIEFLEQRYATRTEETALIDENRRRAALAQLAGIRIDWGGKPIADREALHDHARD